MYVCLTALASKCFTIAMMHFKQIRVMIDLDMEGNEGLMKEQRPMYVVT